MKGGLILEIRKFKWNIWS